MRKLLAIFCVLISVFGAGAQEISSGSVVVVPIDGPITKAQFYFLRRIIKDSEAAGASALVLNMDTPGGELGVTEKIVQALLKTDLPTYTYVNTTAGSAGSLIAIGTDKIYMAPVSAIGAAAVVTGGGEDLSKTMDAKMVSFYSGYFRSVAETKGYNPILVDGFMDLKKEIKIGDKVLSPEGDILTLSAQEAIAEYDGKRLLASGIAKDLQDLCREAGLDGDALVEVTPSGFEQMALLITLLAPLLLLGGMAGAWIEFKSPGFGVAGVISGICFLLFFAGHYVAGLTGYEVVAVFFLGVILVLLELIFFPGVVILATAGIGLMMGSLLFAMVDFYPSQPLEFSPNLLVQPMINLGIAVFLFMIFASVLARFLPDLPIFRRLVLAEGLPAGTSRDIPREELFPVRVQVGDIGVARTVLRPSGTAEFDDSSVDVVTDGAFVERGTALVVLEVRKDQIVVGKA